MCFFRFWVRCHISITSSEIGLMDAVVFHGLWIGADYLWDFNPGVHNKMNFWRYQTVLSTNKFWFSSNQACSELKKLRVVSALPQSTNCEYALSCTDFITLKSEISTLNNADSVVIYFESALSIKHVFETIRRR